MPEGSPSRDKYGQCTVKPLLGKQSTDASGALPCGSKYWASLFNECNTGQYFN